MLLEIICANVLGLTTNLSECSSLQLEKLSTLSGNQTSILTEPIKYNSMGEHRESRVEKPNNSSYKLIADVDYEKRRGIDNNRRDDRYDEEGYDEYDRRRVEAVRNQIEAIDERIDDLEQEKRRLEELERRYRRGYR